MCNHTYSHMANITLALPDELQERMKKHSEIRWSEIVRKSIAQKIEVLEAVEKIAKKSKFTQKDVEELSKKIKAESFSELDRK